MNQLPKTPLDGLVYLASPYTHEDPDVMKRRFEEACRATAHLMSMGWYVFSPIAHSRTTEPYGLSTNWKFWQKYNHLMLDLCSVMVVYKLDGWDISKGVADECEYMENTCTYYMDPLPPGPQESILEEAQRIVLGPRRKNYGHPRKNFQHIAAAWRGLFGWNVTPEQTALAIIVLKMVRQMHSPKRDNLVDIAGYAQTIEMLDDEFTTG